MLGLSGSTIGQLVWLALFFAVLFYFFRGMNDLRQIATRLKRIENILTEWPQPGQNSSTSHIVT